MRSRCVPSRLAACAAAVLAVGGCSGDDVTPPVDGGATDAFVTADAGEDAGVEETCDPFPAFEVGDDGSSMPLGGPATEARAGRLRAEDLPADPTGLATYA